MDSRTKTTGSAGVRFLKILSRPKGTLSNRDFPTAMASTMAATPISNPSTKVWATRSIIQAYLIATVTTTTIRWPCKHTKKAAWKGTIRSSLSPVHTTVDLWNEFWINVSNALRGRRKLDSSVQSLVEIAEWYLNQDLGCLNALGSPIRILTDQVYPESWKPSYYEESQQFQAMVEGSRQPGYLAFVANANGIEQMAIQVEDAWGGFREINVEMNNNGGVIDTDVVSQNNYNNNGAWTSWA
jgi:hypothetical protein